MRELTVLSVRLVRQHLTLYLGCLATIVATAALTSAEAGLVHGFSDITRVHVAGFSTEEVATQLPGIRSILTLLAGLAIAISGVLMITAIRQVIASRQEELAMMRLTGASRGLLARMIASESFILGLLAGLPGALIGAALTYPLFRGHASSRLLWSYHDDRLQVPGRQHVRGDWAHRHCRRDCGLCRYSHQH